jgi:hypothetical protein
VCGSFANWWRPAIIIETAGWTPITAQLHVSGTFRKGWFISCGLKLHRSFEPPRVGTATDLYDMCQPGTRVAFHTRS